MRLTFPSHSHKETYTYTTTNKPLKYIFLGMPKKVTYNTLKSKGFQSRLGIP